MDDLDKFCCLNKNCPQYGICGGKNIRIRALYGKNKDIRLLYCLECHQKFSERRGTIFSDARLPQKTIISLLEQLSKATVWYGQKPLQSEGTEDIVSHTKGYHKSLSITYIFHAKN